MNYEKSFLNYLRKEAGADLELKTPKAKKQWRNKQFAFSRRKNALNKKFTIAPAHIEKLQQLNDLCAREEQRIYKTCIQFEKQILKNKNTAIAADDYEIDIEILFYADEITNKYPEEQLDFVCKLTWDLNFVKDEHYKKDEEKQKTNWLNFANDYGEFSDFNRFKLNNITRTFYTLCERSVLSIPESLQIDRIWWDIDVSYQFLSEIEK